MISKSNDPRKGMKVPDGFFDSIEEDIMKEVSATKVIPLRPRRLYRNISVAAVFIAIIGISYLFSIDTLRQDDVFANLSEDLNWEYLLENYNDISLDEIADFEEYDAAISDLEDELYGDFTSDEILDDVDLEMITNLYE